MRTGHSSSFYTAQCIQQACLLRHLSSSSLSLNLLFYIYHLIQFVSPCIYFCILFLLYLRSKISKLTRLSYLSSSQVKQPKVLIKCHVPQLFSINLAFARTHQVYNAIVRLNWAIALATALGILLLSLLFGFSVVTACSVETRPAFSPEETSAFHVK